MSVWGENYEENEEEGEDEDDEFKNTNDRILFLIDSRRAMFETNSKGESHMKNCLRVVLSVMKMKVIAQDLSTVGLTFFGTREKEGASADNVFTLFNLGPPSAQRIRQIQSFLENMASFDRTIGSQPADQKYCPLKQALWSCSQSFGTKDLKKTDFKRIWIFTNDDNPNSGYPVEQKATVTVARDCAQAGIEISLWHLNPSGRVFDPRAFYLRLLVVTAPSEAGAAEEDSGIDQRMLGGGFDGFDMMLDAARRKQFRKRRMGQALFSFADHPIPGASNSTKVNAAPFMCVQIYKQLQIVKKPLHTWLATRSNEPAKTISRFVDSSTGELLSADQIDTYVDVQGFRLPMDKEDMATLKTKDSWPKSADDAAYTAAASTSAAAMAIATTGVSAAVDDMKGPPGIRLLFCMPRACLPTELNLSTPYFLYPGEKVIKGSAQLFEALLRDLVKKNLVAMVRFSRTANSKAQLAALLPQREEVDEDGTQILPPGLQLIPLPFAEDLRFNPQPDNVMGPEDEEVQALVDNAVAAMTLPVDFDYTKDVDNPALRAFYTTLQTLALGGRGGEEEETVDTMQPRPEALELASMALEGLRGALGLTSEGSGVLPPKPTAKKRAAPKKSGGNNDDDGDEDRPKPKKRAAPKSRGDDSDEDDVPKKKRGVPATKRQRKQAAVDSDDDGDIGKSGDVMEVEDDGGDLSLEEIVELATGGRLPKLTVTELKDVCKSLKLPVSGKKDDLVQRILAKVG